MATPDLDVLVVGAGPTGLALAAQLHAFGIRFRIIDRLQDRGRESRALAVQARSLELLQMLGLGETLLARGDPSARIALHVDGRRVADATLGEIGATDTRFPFILFVSQAETEAVLVGHLTAGGVTIERGVELVSAAPDAHGVACMLRHADGREEPVRTGYVAGCDGAHSTVRAVAGIPFEGGSYPQRFVLGDVEADGPVVPGAINPFVGRGIAVFFPLGRPRTWRVIAMSAADASDASAGDAPATRDLSLQELQAAVSSPTRGQVHLRDPAWLAGFHLHHRQTSHYGAGRLLLAGDAAHIHSPVGGQGMNTGIQDAWNLGWKLALVVRGSGVPRLLDSYEAERWPVGRMLLRFTDRVFGTLTRAVSSNGLAGRLRGVVMRHVLPRVLGSSRLRAAGFRFISQLGIHYRESPLSVEGEPRLDDGPRAGDRLPDARVTFDGRATWLQQASAGPHFTLLLCGDPDGWDEDRLAAFQASHGEFLACRHLSRSARSGALLDEHGGVLARLGVRDAAQYLVRPDGHVAFRCAGRDLGAVERYLATWLVPGVR